MNPDDAPAPGNGEEKHFGFLEVIVLCLSVYVLGAMLIQTLVELPPEVNAMLNQIDFCICMVFLADFFIRFHRAPAKLAFMKWGWIDLLSSIPHIDPLRWGRLARVVRIVRVLRAFGSTRRLVAFLYRRRASSLAGTAILFVTLLLIFSCIAVLAFEDEESSNIKTPFDAIWWAFSTITTVGYGDKFPVTVEGKLVAIVLMIAGVSLFGVITGLFARMLVEPDLQKEDSDIRKLTEEVRRLREKIELMDRPPAGGEKVSATDGDNGKT